MVDDPNSPDAMDELTDFEAEEEETAPPAEGPPPSLGRVLGVIFFLAVILVTAHQVSRTGSGPDTAQPTTAPAQMTEVADRPAQYAWVSLKDRKKYEPLAARILPPDGFTRVDVPAGSFADWLRFLPVLPEGTPVTGPKNAVIIAGNHPSIAAVVALQPHTAKTLSAPNIIVRLRAEYLWTMGKADEAAFHFTSGYLSMWRDWAAGLRPIVKGRNVTVAKAASPDSGRTNFTGYLESIFRYGTVYSLLQDTAKSADPAIEAGCVFVHTGKPGHAVMILDVAKNPQDQVRVLLGEGGTPVQTFHAIRGPNGSPWFPLSRTEPIDLGPVKGVYQLRDLRHWPE